MTSPWQWYVILAITSVLLVRSFVIDVRAHLLAQRRFREPRLWSTSLPFRVELGPGDEGPVTVQPQRLFRPEHLTVTCAVPGLFRILGIKVAGEQFFAAPGELDAELIGIPAGGMPFNWGTLKIGQTIELYVKNVSTQKAELRGIVKGKQVCL